jgi:hypothetical protein
MVWGYNFNPLLEKGKFIGMIQHGEAAIKIWIISRHEILV